MIQTARWRSSSIGRTSAVKVSSLALKALSSEFDAASGGLAAGQNNALGSDGNLYDDVLSPVGQCLACRYYSTASDCKKNRQVKQACPRTLFSSLEKSCVPCVRPTD
jgi:hypothetical protein